LRIWPSNVILVSWQSKSPGARPPATLALHTNPHFEKLKRDIGDNARRDNLEGFRKPPCLVTHNADGSLTLALSWYRLGELAKGDRSIEAGEKKGKARSLCLLRMAIARYHTVKKSPRKEATEQLREGVFLIDQAIKFMDSTDSFIAKNMREAVRRADTKISS
jgi:hypothetical protein